MLSRLLVILTIQLISLVSFAISSSKDMQILKPQIRPRLWIFNKALPSISREAESVHDRYTDPRVLKDVEDRLNRVAQSGDPKEILSESEWDQFQENILILQDLEKVFFERWYLKEPLSKIVRLQEKITKKRSPMPTGESYDRLKRKLTESLETDILYKNWWSMLPIEYIESNGPETWGQLLLLFNSDLFFRQYWITTHGESLPFLRKLTERWASEDNSIRSITIRNQDQANEYWVLNRLPRDSSKNRFDLAIQKDIDGILDLEFQSTVLFNRVSKITRKGSSIWYTIESIEKGRSMELTIDEEYDKIVRGLFKGAEILRVTKSDELPQRKYVGDSLSLFLGPRINQFHEIITLMKINPDLVQSVGQFGFSVTGGRAQMISVRTNDVKSKLSKLTASLIDIIEFANHTDINSWFKMHEKYLLRVVSTGLGSGNSIPSEEKESISLPNFKNTNPIMCSDFLK